jgi:gamma-glutamyltranspeptidase / glutathione hydrolase
MTSSEFSGYAISAQSSSTASERNQMMGTRSQWLIDKSEATSSTGMVSAMQPLAAEAGAEMLRKGGNAIDAAIATVFSIGVVEPYMSGVGGIAFLVYRDASTGETVCLDGSTILPRAMRPELFELLGEDQRSGMYGWRATKDNAAEEGWLTPAVPGMPGMAAEAHRRWGKLAWEDVLAPAIRLAEEGFEVDHYFTSMTAASYRKLQKVDEARKTFFAADGAPLAPAVGSPGDLLKQPDLARTLRLIARDGVDVIYRGEIGQRIADDMQRHGGLITMEDLADFAVQEFAPHQCDYRGHQVLGQLRNTGYPTVVEALQLLEGFDIPGMGAHSATGRHLVAESIRHAFIDRLRFLGDADLQPVPMEGLVSRAYAEQRRGDIDPERATPDAVPGDPWSFDPGDGPRPERSGNGGDSLTTHMSVIDRDHNMVSLTSTLGALYGSGVVIEGTGIVLNNATMWFDPEPGAVTTVGPGKRVMSAATPVLVLKDGQPFASIGSPGGRRVISAVYQILVNMIDDGMSVQSAISSPRLHSEGPLTEISSRVSPDVIEYLKSIGHQVAMREETLSSSYFARPNGVMIDLESGELRGGAFPYSPSTAVGI